MLIAISYQKIRALEVSFSRVRGLESTKIEGFAEKLARECA